MTSPRERRTILEGIVNIVVPNQFNDGLVSGNNNVACIDNISSSDSNGDSVSFNPCGADPSSSALVESVVIPQVIAKKFTPTTAYLCQFENAFDLFLMQNPAILPGNADTLECLQCHLLRANAKCARVKVELASQLRCINEIM